MRHRLPLIFLLLLLPSFASAAAEPPAAKPAESAPPPPPPARTREDAEKSEQRLRDEEPKIVAHMAQITEELKALDRAALKDTDWAKEWAGEYYDGDGLGRNFTIRLAPKSGIAATNYGCLGFYGGDHGTIVEVLPDGLKIKPVLGADKDGMLDERLYFVRWGDRRYLVPEYSMMKLVNN